MPIENPPTRLAVLIDAENVEGGAAALGPILSRIGELGSANLKRAYGDFSEENLKGWGSALSEHAIDSVQRFKTKSGKNSSDIALVIDAMDQLYSGRFDGFCIVASDGDYTWLVNRLRADGKKVFVFCGKQPAASLIAACDAFIELEVPEAENGVAADCKAEARLHTDDPIEALLSAVRETACKTGWAHLSKIGKYLKEECGNPDDGTTTPKLKKRLEESGRFDLKGEGGQCQARIRTSP